MFVYKLAYRAYGFPGNFSLIETFLLHALQQLFRELCGGITVLSPLKVPNEMEKVLNPHWFITGAQ